MGVSFPWPWPAATVESAHWSLREITAPTAEPITLAQAKTHLRIDAAETFFDTDITAQIIAARQQLEKEVSRFVARATYDLAFDSAAYGGILTFPYSTISSITSLTVYSTTHVATVAAAASYRLDRDSIPPRLILYGDVSEPAYLVDVRTEQAAIVRFIGGPESGAASPAWAVQAIYLLLELWRTPKPDPVVQLAYDRLVNLHRSMEVA